MADAKKHEGASIYAVLFATAVVIFLIVLFAGGVISPAETENSDKQEEVSEQAVLSSAVAFDGCGRVAKYSSKTWWEAFFNRAREHLTEAQLEVLNERFEGCMMLDETLFVALVPDGEYFSKDSKIFRYEPAKDRLMALDFSDAVDEKAFNVTAFWRRVDDYINVSAEFGDAGTGIKWDARYYFDRNEVELTRKCVTELEPAEGGGSKTECEDL